MLPVIEALTSSTCPLAQRDDRDDQLGGVAERRVEETAQRRARPARQLLGAEADQAGERNQRRGGREEDPRRLPASRRSRTRRSAPRRAGR